MTSWVEEGEEVRGGRERKEGRGREVYRHEYLMSKAKSSSQVVIRGGKI